MLQFDHIALQNLPDALQVNPKVIVHKHVTEGIPFLGFVTFPQQRRLKRRKGVYFQRKLRHLIAACRTGDIPASRVTASVQGWVNHVRYGNTVGLRKAVLGRYQRE
jgi:hypothetical protein